MTIAIQRAGLDEAAPDELRRRIVSSLKDVQAEPH
jgi:hypothetical protein